MHVFDPVELHLPVAHGLHSVEAVVGAYVPAGQDEQYVPVEDVMRPAGQALHEPDKLMK